MNSRHLQATARKEPWTLFRLVNLIPLVLLALVIAIMVWLWHRMQNPREYPIRHVKISTIGQYVDPKIIKHLIKESVEGGFFSLNIQQIKNTLLNNAWIKSVSIRRVWPNSLDVTITEQQPYARWGAAGVVSRDGNVFYPNAKTIPANLPVINAPMSVKDNAMSSFADFNHLLQPLGLQIMKLIVTQRLAWTVQLNNGIQVNLCRNNTENRFNNFVKLYPQLIGNKAQDIVSVSLCYPNGLAVKWKGGKAPQLS